MKASSRTRNRSGAAAGKSSEPQQALGRDAILAMEDAGRMPVDIPEWKGRVWVRTMTARERDQLDAWAVAAQMAGEPNQRAQVAVICCCDEAGKRLFTEADIPDLAKKAAKPMERISEAAAKLNYIGFKSAKALEKN